MELKDIYTGLEAAGLTDILSGLKNHIGNLNSESAGHRKKAEEIAAERDSFRTQIETVKNGGSLEILTLKTRLEALENTVTEKEKQLIEKQKETNSIRVKTTLKERLAPLFDKASDLLAATAERDNIAVFDEAGIMSLRFGDKVYAIDDVEGHKLIGAKYGIPEMVTVQKGKPAPLGGLLAVNFDKFKGMNQTELMKYSMQSPEHRAEVFAYEKT